jgi:benzoyl-CoA reductase subunit B
VTSERTSGGSSVDGRVPKQLACSARASEFSRKSFQELRRRVLDEKVPYILANAEMPHEVFEVLGLPVVTGEWWGGVIAAKGQAGRYLDWANQHGFHRNLGAYNALGLLSLIAEVPDPPWGGLPKPSLICAPHREQAAELLNRTVAERLGVPYIGIDIPASTRFYPRWWEMARDSWEELYETDRIDVVLQQYREMAKAAEAIAGRELDLRALREKIHAVNRQEAYFDDARRIIATAPKAPVRVSEQMSNTMTAQWHRGSPWAVEHARQFRDEVAGRAASGIGVIEDERLRLMWIGVGLWHNTAFYSAFEESHGAVFVWSMYLALAADGYIKNQLRDPLRALAARYLNLGEQAHAPPWAGEWMVHEAARHRVNGAVLLRSPSQRHQLSGNIFQRQALEAAGIPVLEITADPTDERGWNEADMRERVARFIEERLKS